MSIIELQGEEPNPFTAPAQIDLFGLGDPRGDIELAFKMAECDARELKWLSEAHLIAYGAGRQDECIRIINRIRAIKGPAVRPCTPKYRVTRDGRTFRRRAFATGFTTW